MENSSKKPIVITMKVLMLVIGAPSIITASSIMTKNYIGFCRKDEKFYSDNDMIESAINHELVKLSRSKNHNNNKLSISYSSKIEFKNRNKNCCRIERSSKGSESVIGKLLGGYRVAVQLGYMGRTGLDDKPYNFSETFLNSCREVVASYGPSHWKTISMASEGKYTTRGK